MLNKHPFLGVFLIFLGFKFLSMNMHHYEGVTDIIDLAAVYLVAIARGHIFNDANKRTALFVAQVFLKRNGVHIISSRISFDEMQIIALNAATGEYDWKMVSDHLKAIILN
ncbi:TPA: type II toxin-antitoxin system death-on-curing family toxin [Escherichia coli]